MTIGQVKQRSELILRPAAMGSEYGYDALSAGSMVDKRTGGVATAGGMEVRTFLSEDADTLILYMGEGFRHIILPNGISYIYVSITGYTSMRLAVIQEEDVAGRVSYRVHAPDIRKFLMSKLNRDVLVVFESLSPIAKEIAYKTIVFDDFENDLLGWSPIGGVTTLVTDGSNMVGNRNGATGGTFHSHALKTLTNLTVGARYRATARVTAYSPAVSISFLSDPNNTTSGEWDNPAINGASVLETSASPPFEFVFAASALTSEMSFTLGLRNNTGATASIDFVHLEEELT